MLYPQFCGGSSKAQSILSDVETLINKYVERSESEGATTQYSLYPVPGTERITLDPAVPGVGREHFFQDGREFAVIGGQFVEINGIGAMTVRGAVAIDANPATISSSGDAGGELFITSGGNGYLFTLATNAFAVIPALNGIATMGDYLDNYFLAFDGSSSTVRISDLLDGATWDPTNFFQRSQASDPWVAMRVYSKFICLVGEITGEVWADFGTFPIAFQPHPSGFFTYGCSAPFSLKPLQGVLYWLGRSQSGQGVVLKMAGFTPEEVSSTTLQVSFNDYATLADAVAWTYDDLGHTFWGVTLPTANKSWAYDIELPPSIGWHQRATWDSAAGVFNSWRPIHHAFAFGEHRMLDTNSGQLLRMSSDISTDVDGGPLVWERTAPGLEWQNQRLFYGAFEILMEVGTGVSVGQGSDPMVMLTWSDDGGHTYGNEILGSIGKIGEYNKRVIFHRLGMSRKRVFRVRGSDPVPYRIQGATIGLINPPQGLGQ